MLSGQSGKSRRGGILRDPEGRFIVAFAKVFDVAKSLQAELKAVLEGVRLCVQRGFAEVHVESDSLLLVRMFHAEVGIPWWLMRDFEELLALRHHVRVMTHCRREANRSAVGLAMESITQVPIQFSSRGSSYP